MAEHLCVVCSQTVSPYKKGPQIPSRKRSDMRFCSRKCWQIWHNDAANVTERFWTFVNKHGTIHPTHGQCWEWLGVMRRAYGAFRSFPRSVTHTPEAAHRYSWRLHFGPIPDGHDVLHRCDNPPCVNPSHLFTGTDIDNSNDKIAKGRLPNLKGERCSAAILTEPQVVEIRQRHVYRSPINGTVALAKEFGVSHSTVSNIISRKNWSHVK